MENSLLESMQTNRVDPLPMLEIEAKFSVTDRTYLESLKKMGEVGGLRLRYPKEFFLVDRYYDTRTWSLREAGYACRVRKIGSRTWLSLKSTGSFAEGIHRREEIEIPLSGNRSPEDWPSGPVTGIVDRIRGNRCLVEKCVLRQKRSRRLVFRGRRAVAELALDEVQAEFGGRTACFFEVELELKPPETEETLHSLAGALREMGLDPEPRSKLEQALILVGESEEGESDLTGRHWKKAKKKRHALRPDDTMCRAGVKILRKQFRRLRKRASKVRDGGEVETLHQMRVATRRLRAALRLFGPSLPADRVKPLRKRTKSLARALGRVRDLDVLLEGIDDYLSNPDLSVTERELLQPLIGHWKAGRNRAGRKLRKFLAGKEYQSFLDGFRELTDWCKAGDDPPNRRPPKQLRYVIPSLVFDRLESVRSFEPYLDQAPPETYHTLRIECKHLRYSLEFFRSLMGPGVEEVIETVVEIQELLGGFHDAHVAIQALDHFAAVNKKTKDFSNDTPSAIEHYRCALQEKQRRRLDGFFTVWKDFCDPAFRRRVADLVLEL